MYVSNATLDRAEELAAEERQSGIRAASRALSGTGSIECIGCGNPIGAKRRAAIPSATRCHECQTDYEREQVAR
jgi:phage/conjugal plasmid C-4 type zinc finger TraR family protein